MQIRYIGPHDAVEVDSVGIVKRGEAVSVSNALAGRPPVGDPEADDHDPGVGLLAQPSNWEPVQTAGKKDEVTS